MKPYFIDRRNVPGPEPPREGVWERGDGIINVEPDPNIPAKACRGGVCIAADEPGQWVSNGQLGG